MIKYVITAADHISNQLSKELYPELELIPLYTIDNGTSAFAKFDELGQSALLITATTPLHLSIHADNILKKYRIIKYIQEQNYVLIGKSNIQYNIEFKDMIVGGVSSPIGRIATSLVKANKYIKYETPNDSLAALMSNEVDIIAKPTGCIDLQEKSDKTHIVCNLTKEFGLKVHWYVLSNNIMLEHDEYGLCKFNQERILIQKLAKEFNL